eukprot:comp21030_c0_seq1/m.44149 comp21030_c0_seq1/g.44149  ORF comp21030_c0_seq1/g.44149 comp21030_c0_seq1/m.44149 type:complete len:342 (-) comp21030_c0_seq1:574-1599(-)
MGFLCVAVDVSEFCGDVDHKMRAHIVFLGERLETVGVGDLQQCGEIAVLVDFDAGNVFKDKATVLGLAELETWCARPGAPCCLSRLAAVVSEEIACGLVVDVVDRDMHFLEGGEEVSRGDVDARGVAQEEEIRAELREDSSAASVLAAPKERVAFPGHCAAECDQIAVKAAGQRTQDRVAESRIELRLARESGLGLVKGVKGMVECEMLCVLALAAADARGRLRGLKHDLLAVDLHMVPKVGIGAHFLFAREIGAIAHGHDELVRHCARPGFRGLDDRLERGIAACCRCRCRRRRDIAESGKLDWQRAVRLGRQLARGLLRWRGSRRETAAERRALGIAMG